MKKDFSFLEQFRKCQADGTCKLMSDDELDKLDFEQKKWGFIKGSLSCGKKPGICSSKHCREIHLTTG